MAGRSQTGHNQMLRRRRKAQLRKKRLAKAARNAEKQQKKS